MSEHLKAIGAPLPYQIMTLKKNNTFSQAVPGLGKKCKKKKVRIGGKVELFSLELFSSNYFWIIGNQLRHRDGRPLILKLFTIHKEWKNIKA